MNKCIEKLINQQIDLLIYYILNVLYKDIKEKLKNK